MLALNVFYKISSHIFTRAKIPYVITATPFVVQNYVITAWRIGGGIHDEEQQLKTKFGAELTQELSCLVSKVVCVETNKVVF